MRYDNVRSLFKIIQLALFAVILTACGQSQLAVADAQLARGEYFAASKSYRKVYRKLTKKSQRDERGAVALKLAECHNRLNQPVQAGVAYQNAIRLGHGGAQTRIQLGRMLQAQGKYEAALKEFEAALDMIPGDEEAMTGMRGVRRAIQAREKKSRMIVRPVKQINGRRSDFSPMLLDGVLYFTSTNEQVKGMQRSDVTGMKRSDIMTARRNERGEWLRPEPAYGDLNSENDEGIVSFSPDGSTMYLTRASKPADSDSRVEICISRRSDAQWSAARHFDLIADTAANYGHPAVSPSGRWLYFSSDREGGYGGRDLWRMSLGGSGRMENLGDDINTGADEMFPYLLTDSIIYFSSNGHPGFGGLDIFRGVLLPSGRWSVENIGTPINSPADDFGMTFESTDPQSGFFSSNRGDNRGYDHIYSFELPDLKINISGSVTDLDEEPVRGAVIRIVGDDGTNRKAVARNDGTFSFPLERGVRYAMLAGAKGYLNAQQEFTSDLAEEDAEYNVDFALASVEKPNIVENIFYDFDKATLRPESKSALDGLVKMLADNPNITIEMGAHTDRVGSDAYNDKLSERRAKSVVDYLIAAGISADRLQARGYGKTQPKMVTKRIAREFPQFTEGTLLDDTFVGTLSDDDKAAADQINRRTEFRILSLDYGLY